MPTDPLSLISSIPSLLSLFSGKTTSPYQKQQERLADQQAQISQALMQGSNNPLYQQLYGQYEQQNKNNLASTIAEAQAQNRMNSNMGRTPLFNNERGSENIFRTLTQGMQNSGVQSDQQTRAALGQALGGTGNALDGYNSITNSTANANKAQNLGFQGIYDFLRGNNAAPQANSIQANSMGIAGPNGYNTNYNPANFLQPSVGSMGGGTYGKPNQSPSDWGLRY